MKRIIKFHTDDSSNASESDTVKIHSDVTGPCSARDVAKSNNYTSDAIQNVSYSFFQNNLRIYTPNRSDEIMSGGCIAIHVAIHKIRLNSTKKKKKHTSGRVKNIRPHILSDCFLVNFYFFCFLYVKTRASEYSFSLSSLIFYLHSRVERSTMVPYV